MEETGLTKSGEREFAPNARIDYDETILRWMDHYLRGMDNGVDREPPVRLYIMGDNRWREGRTWPPEGVQFTSYYLAGAGPQKKGGALRARAPADQQFSVFDSDPAHPVVDPYEGWLGGHDFRDLAKRSDVLVFDTEPLPRDVEVTGPITADVFAGCDCPDFDLIVRLIDVAPDGTAWNLMSPGADVLRASYRNANRRQLITPGKVYELKLTNLRTGNVFKAGHRIRVQISASFFPDLSRNLQTGKSETTSAEMRAAQIRIYHDREHPSRVVLPVIPR